jgi:hypothetical protein
MSWLPHDLSEVVRRCQDGTITTPEPTVGRMTNGKALLYRRATNGLAGPPGSGKTWFGMAIEAQELSRGNAVMFVDYEDSPETHLSRLFALGVTAEQILSGLIYVHPEERLRQPDDNNLVELMRERKPAFVVIDSVGESMAMEGIRPNDDDEVARWFQRFPSKLAKWGAAVLVLDHVTKAAEGGLWAIGSQRKLAGIRGVQYMLSTVEPFTREQAGLARLICAKDRHGNYQRGAAIADLRIVPFGDDRLSATFEPASGEKGRPDKLMQRIVDYLAGRSELVPVDDVVRGIGSRRADVLAALRFLDDEGTVSREKAGRKTVIGLCAPPVPMFGTGSGNEYDEVVPSSAPYAGNPEPLSADALLIEAFDAVEVGP